MKTLASALRTSLVATLAACAVHAGPNVNITKTCPGMRYLGRNATFDITVNNEGDAPAHGVVVTDTVAGGVEFVSADNDGKLEGDDIVWRIGTLEAGKTRTVKATVRCDKIGKVTSTARVDYCAEMVDSCSFEVKGIPAILLECVDAPDPNEVGSELTYTITVLNQGSAVGTSITINCTLPPEQEYVSSTGPTKAKASDKTVAFAPVPALAPKATAEFKVTVKAIAAGDARFKVELTSDQLTRPVMETESTNLY